MDRDCFCSETSVRHFGHGSQCPYNEDNIRRKAKVQPSPPAASGESGAITPERYDYLSELIEVWKVNLDHYDVFTKDQQRRALVLCGDLLKKLREERAAGAAAERVRNSSMREVLKTISVSCRDRCADELPDCDCCRCAAKRVLRALEGGAK